MMTEYFTDNEVYYKIFNNRNTKSEIVSITAAENSDKNDKKEKIEKVYPFSVFATDPMIELLSQSNRLN